MLKRATHDPDAQKMLDVIEKYARALELLDDYDHQRLKKPEGTIGAYVLTYEECKALIAQMKLHTDSTVFGNEKDESFQSSINAIYQSFDGRDVYPSIEEKAANIILYYKEPFFHGWEQAYRRCHLFVFFGQEWPVVFRWCETAGRSYAGSCHHYVCGIEAGGKGGHDPSGHEPPAISGKSICHTTSPSYYWLAESLHCTSSGKNCRSRINNSIHVNEKRLRDFFDPSRSEG